MSTSSEEEHDLTRQGAQMHELQQNRAIADYSDPGELSIAEIRRGAVKSEAGGADEPAWLRNDPSPEPKASKKDKAARKKSASPRSSSSPSPAKEKSPAASAGGKDTKSNAAAVPKTGKEKGAGLGGGGGSTDGGEAAGSGRKSKKQKSGSEKVATQPPLSKKTATGKELAQTATAPSPSTAHAAASATSKSQSRRRARASTAGEGADTASPPRLTKDNGVRLISGPKGTSGRSPNKYVSSLETPGPKQGLPPPLPLPLPPPLSTGRGRPAASPGASRRAATAVQGREEEEETPTPPQYANKRKGRARTGTSSKSPTPRKRTAAAEDRVSLDSAGGTASSQGRRMAAGGNRGEGAPPRSPSKRASEGSDGGAGSAIVGQEGAGPGMSAASSKETPSKRRRIAVAQPTTPTGGVSSSPSRGSLLLSPHTPNATQAQETFLAELRALLGAIETSDPIGGQDRRRKTASPSRAGHAAGAPGVGKGLDEAVYWKGRFEELSALRETAAEEALARFREDAAERDRKAEQYLKELREKAATASGASSTGSGAGEAASASSSAQDGDSAPASSAYVRSLEEKLAYHKRVIQLYQTLSSLAIHPSEDTPGRENVMTCTAVNHLHRRAVRFDLTVPRDEDNEDYAYRATGNAHILPEYMRHELLFTNKQCPLFLAKLLQNLFRA